MKKRERRKKKASFLSSFPTYAKRLNVVSPHAGLTFVHLEVLLHFHRWALVWENLGLLPEPLPYCHNHRYAILATRHFWYQLKGHIRDYLCLMSQPYPPPPPPKKNPYTQGHPFPHFQNKISVLKGCTRLSTSESSSCLYRGKYPRVVVSLHLPSLDSWWFNRFLPL